MSPDGAYVGVWLTGHADQTYRHPITPGAFGGTVDSELNAALSQPEAELTPAGRSTLGARPVPAQGQSVWMAPVPRLAGTFHVVDAGDAASPRTAKISGRIAMVAGSCGDLTATAARLAAAGAAAMLAYASHGAACAGTIQGTPPLPSLAMRPVPARALLAAGNRAVRVVTHTSPEYAYDLAAAWHDRVPDGATVDATGDNVAALVEHYDTAGGTSADGLGLYENLTGFLPGMDSAVFGLSRRVPFPGTVTHYVTAAARWDKEAVVADDALGGAYAAFYSPGRTYAGGSTTQDTWFGGPIGAFSSAAAVQAYGWGVLSNRQGDSLYLQPPLITDAAGHGGEMLFWDEYEAKLYQAGQLVVDAWDPLMLMGYPAPPQPTRFRLDVDDHRSSVFWQHSTDIHTVWGFTSRTPAGDHAVLPLMDVRYAMPLSDRGTAPAGAFGFGVTLSMPAEVAATPVAAPRVEVSWDGGSGWQPAGLRGCTGTPSGAAGTVTRCQVVVANHAGGTASLRVTARDAAGRTVQQTIVDAYAVR